MFNENKFQLSDDNGMYAWIFEGVDIIDIDSAEEYVEDYAQNVISATNPTELDDDEIYQTWRDETYEYEEAVNFVQSKMDAYVSEHLTVIVHAGVTFQDHYTPECPICGMEPQRNENDNELTYACGHFVDVYNAWADGTSEADRWGYAKLSTHLIETSHVLGGVNEWFFDAKSDELNAVMTSSEIAEKFGIDDSTIRQAVRRGSLRARKSGNVLLVLRKDAQARWGRS